MKQTVLSEIDRLPIPPGYSLPGGASQQRLDGFEERTGLRLPAETRDWLSVCNGALIGPGGVYGVRPREDWLDIESILTDFPSWQTRGWIPVAGDGNGNHYVASSAASPEPAGIIMFVEPLVNPANPSFAVASGTWHFLHGLFSIEQGETWWP